MTVVFFFDFPYRVHGYLDQIWIKCEYSEIIFWMSEEVNILVSVPVDYKLVNSKPRYFWGLCLLAMVTILILSGKCSLRGVQKGLLNLFRKVDDCDSVKKKLYIPWRRYGVGVWASKILPNMLLTHHIGLWRGVDQIQVTFSRIDCLHIALY